jgi:effector-binding domain-containing protein
LFLSFIGTKIRAGAGEPRSKRRFNMKRCLSWTAAILFALCVVPITADSGTAGGRAEDTGVTIKDVAPFAYCAVPHKGPYTDMSAVIGQLINAMQTQGLFSQIRGPMVGVYYNSPGETPSGDLAWEAGFIIAAGATPQPPLEKKTWEHKTVAVALHVGPYEKCGETVARIMTWLSAGGYEAAGPVLDRYLDMNPMAIKPEERRTEIWVPCKRK